MKSQKGLVRTSIVLVAILALSAAASAGGDRVRDSEPPGPTNPEGVLDLLYRATGVTNISTVATSVHCTNIGTSNGWITLRVLNWNGDSACSILNHQIAPDDTETLSTQNTSIYVEDATCDGAPTVNQGMLSVWAEPTGSTDIICTAQVLDPGADTPAFATTLTLYRR